MSTKNGHGWNSNGNGARALKMLMRGDSCRKVANEIGTTYATISTFARENGIARGVHCKTRNAPSMPEDVKLIKRAYLTGLSDSDIAQAIGSKAAAVANRIAYYRKRWPNSFPYRVALDKLAA